MGVLFVRKLWLFWMGGRVDLKPILFNTEMVRAVLDGRKTATRRIIKLKYNNSHIEWHKDKYGKKLVEKQNNVEGETYGVKPEGTHWQKLLTMREITSPYKVGDILYVRETWAKMCCCECGCTDEECKYNIDRSGLTIFCDDGVFVYKATDSVNSKPKWHPSIHMPKEAARIFLRVTDVRVERLQDITHDEITKEGIVTKGNFGSPERINPYFAFKNLWNSTINKSDLDKYGWNANPWVWVIEFERISKEQEK